MDASTVVFENGDANNSLNHEKSEDQQKVECGLDNTNNMEIGQVEVVLNVVDERSSLQAVNIEPKAKTSKTKNCGKSRQKGRRRKAFPKGGYRMYNLRSSEKSLRVLRSRSHGTGTTSTNTTTRSVDFSSERKKSRRKRKDKKKNPADEYSKLRKHIRYLVSRITYEQSLLDAYAGEGWKGQSADKIKPEKELQRASSEILQCKLKIRNLLQQLDNSCAEGGFGESLFDSEGQIDSEDIFCSKCGSKELSVGNDIILCDGVCDRGFHQMCLDPPLLKEQFPPEDEGWLCPGCDCKVDCIDLLNDLLGTDLSIDDNWEKVFPEAAAVAAGSKPYEDLGLSDDSEDYDYDPDRSELHPGEEDGEGSSSGESSYFTSASDDSSTSASHKQCVPCGFSSDDSEDHDYDPNGPDPDENVKKEASSSDESDFTSDTDDLGVLDDDGDGETAIRDSIHTPFVGWHSETSTARDQGVSNGKRKRSMSSELASLLADNPIGQSALSLSGKRHCDWLDYKKLHDEEFENVSSDSSDDEDWTGTSTPKSRRNVGEGISSTPLLGQNDLTTQDANNIVAARRRLRQKKENNRFGNGKNEVSPRKTWKKLEYEGSHHSSPRSDSIGIKSPVSGSKTFSKLISQRLHQSFKENIYPSREMKQNLSSELGITVRQVGRWYETARRRLRLSNKAETNGTENISPNKNLLKASKREEKREMEEYGNVSSDSSPVEDLSGPSTPKSGRIARRIASISALEKNDLTTQDTNKYLTSSSETQKKLEYEGSHYSSPVPCSGSPQSGSIGIKSSNPGSKTFGKSISQRLLQSFKENIYPSREIKQNLSSELGITMQQVSKWFENARRSSRVSRETEASGNENISRSKDTPNARKTQVDREMANRWFEHAHRRLQRSTKGGQTDPVKNCNPRKTTGEANGRDEPGYLPREKSIGGEDGGLKVDKEAACAYPEGCLQKNDATKPDNINSGNSVLPLFRKRKIQYDIASGEPGSAKCKHVGGGEMDPQKVERSQEKEQRNGSSRSPIRTRSRKSIS